MVFEKEISDLNELPNVAKEILQHFSDYHLFLFEGEMGSGKTTLIKELCKQLGSTNNFSSPSYSIVNEYKTPHTTIFHFDLYRLKRVEELMDIGFEDYLSKNAIIFIEWPQIALDYLKNEKYVNVNIKVTSEKRLFNVLSN